jgi:hypothetical protein
MLDFTSLEILPECKYCKNLKPGKYEFGQYGVKDFYGENVTLHALVGKNGSGKSSLLDLVLRIMNNVGALLCKREARNASEHVKYVRHIFADLSYKKSTADSQIDTNIVHQCKICVRDTVLWIEYDKTIYMLSEAGLIAKCNNGNAYITELKNRPEEWRYEDYCDMQRPKIKQSIASLIFYTIATNYSMLGFQSDDYADEDSLEFRDDIKLVDKDGASFVDKFDRAFCISGWTERKNWITDLFHKNDGYMCPVVLNPYRDEGRFNMATEAHLTVNRLASIFINEHFDNTPIIDNYALDYILYTPNDNFYLEFSPIVDHNDKNKNILADGGDIRLFYNVAQIEHTWSWSVLHEFDIPIRDGLNDAEIKARLYIVYKVSCIAAKYPHYFQFREYGEIDKAFVKSTMVQESCHKLHEFISQIKERHTHVEHKIHQTLTFLQKVDKLKTTNADIAWLNQSFKYSQYREQFYLPEQFNSIEDCMNNLPPSIYKQSIFLKQVGERRIIAKDIPLSRMSSGQKQMLYQLSTLIYHALNIKSVDKKDIHYNHLNIILDEIEVCFHPEYQRMFISRLLDLLCDKLHLNKTFGIHIWLTTHSPFILSDIPEELIVYLKDGYQLNKQEMRTIRPSMAANISALLHQSFFLENGFIGEYARQKIISLVDFFDSKEAQSLIWTEETAATFIKGISEPYISAQLRKLYYKRYAKDIY